MELEEALAEIEKLRELLREAYRDIAKMYEQGEHHADVERKLVELRNGDRDETTKSD